MPIAITDVRSEDSLPIRGRIKAWLDQEQGRILLKNALSAAMNYRLNSRQSGVKERIDRKNTHRNRD